ncbi:HYC_CC_PP family protein [Arenibacter hampyeongensis]
MIQKILAMLMAFFMLASTVSWTIEKHYCFGSLVDIAFFHEADTCGMDVGLVNATFDKKGNPCCALEVITIPGQDDLKISYHDIDLGHQLFLVAYVAYHISLFQPKAQPLVPHADYPPPILVKDIHILDQVFLI